MLSPYHPLQLALGLAVWLVWFSALYGVLSVACAVAPPTAEQGPWTWINGLLLLMTLVTALLLGYWAYRCWLGARRMERGAPRHLVAWVASAVHLTAAVATVAVGLTTLFLPPCL